MLKSALLGYPGPLVVPGGRPPPRLRGATGEGRPRRGPRREGGDGRDRARLPPGRGTRPRRARGVAHGPGPARRRRRPPAPRRDAGEGQRDNDVVRLREGDRGRGPEEPGPRAPGRRPPRPAEGRGRRRGSSRSCRSCRGSAARRRSARSWRSPRARTPRSSPPPWPRSRGGRTRRRPTSSCASPATQSREHFRAAAQGYVRLVGRSEMPVAKKLDAFQKLLALPAEDADRRPVLAGIAAVREPGSLRLLARYLDDPALRDAAASALLNLASRQRPGRALALRPRGVLGPPAGRGDPRRPGGEGAGRAGSSSTA